MYYILGEVELHVDRLRQQADGVAPHLLQGSQCCTQAAAFYSI